jgi:3-isopropylmalate dehydrogenase
MDKANPVAAIASAAMMFSYTFNMDRAAVLIEEAILRTLNNGCRTADISTEGTQLCSTTKMTEEIKKNLNLIYEEQASGILAS